MSLLDPTSAIRSRCRHGRDAGKGFHRSYYAHIRKELFDSTCNGVSLSCRITVSASGVISISDAHDSATHGVATVLVQQEL